MSVRPTSKALYHEHDSRVDVCDLYKTNIEDKWIIEEQSRSVVCLVKSDKLVIDNDLYHIRDPDYTLTKSFAQNSQFRVQLVDEDRFRNNPVLSFGSGFLTTPDTIMTAAHCICHIDSGELNDEHIKETLIVFNFIMIVDGVFRTTFKKSEVFKIRKVKQYKFLKEYVRDKEGYESLVKSNDWAWIQLDREVKGIKPLVIDFSPVSLNDDLYMLGYPCGIPQKFANKAKVRKNVNEDFFEADIDSFKGNSGSPIIKKTTKQVVGILFGGNSDFEYVCNYGGTDQKRVKVHSVTSAEISRNYEQCQRMDKIVFELRITWQEKAQRERLSQESSLIFQKRLKGEISIKKSLSLHCLFNRGSLQEYSSKTSGIVSLILNVINIFKDKVILNFQEAFTILSIQGLVAEQNGVFILKKDTENCLDLTKVDCRILKVIKNMIAFNLPQDKAWKLFNFEILFSERFSPIRVLKLMQYEESHDIIFTYKTRKRILKILHKCINITVEEARVEACVKFIRKQPRYANYSVKVIERIAKFMVTKAPKMSFEDVRDKLGL